MANLFSSINLDSPLSLYSIPVIWFNSFYPHSWKFFTIDNLVGYNNVFPRYNTAKNMQGKLSPALVERMARMEGAHQNGNENMPLWFAAVIAGNIAGLDNRWLNKMALLYVASRIAYNVTYINFGTFGKGWPRTLLFFGGLCFPLRILFKAAEKMASH